MTDTTSEKTTITRSEEDVEKGAGRTSITDGGINAWMTVAGSWMIQFCTLGYINAFGVYQDYYTREFLSDKTPSDISWIGSFQLFMQYAPGVFVGRTFDAGYFHTMIIVGSCIQVASMFMLSLVQPGQFYQVFLAQAVGSGLGQSLLFLPSLSIIGHHFKKRRAVATGIVVTGASFGGIVWPIMLNELGRITSFVNAIRSAAALAAALLIFANLIMRTSYQDAQLPALFNTEVFREVLTDTTFMVSVVGACFVCLGLFLPYFYIQLYAIEQGIDPSLAFYALAILNAGSILGRLLPNFIADRIGIYNMLVSSLACTSILLFTLVGADIKNMADLVVFACFYGFFSGSYYSLIPSLICQLTTDMSDLGTRMGLAFTCVGLFMLCGSPLDGALLRSDSITYNWARCLAFCASAVMLGALCMLLSRFMFVHQRRGDQHTQKV